MASRHENIEWALAQMVILLRIREKTMAHNPDTIVGQRVKWATDALETTDMSEWAHQAEPPWENLPIVGRVLCREDHNIDLTKGKVYDQLADDTLERESIRIIDDSGEDYIYPRDWFRSEGVIEEVDDG